MLDEKAAAKVGTISVSDKTTDKPTEVTNNKVEDPKNTANATRTAAASAAEERRLAKAKDLEERKKAIEEKRLKALADREAAIKAKEEARNKKP
jgi:hypothetical protein